MQEKKKEYKSSLRSKKVIKETFLELMNIKPINKITVTDIVKKADINRSTFYAHFQDIRAIIESFEDEIFEKMKTILSDFKYNNFFHDPLPTLLRINRYLEEDLEFYRTLILYKDSTGFFDKFNNTFLSYLEDDKNIPEKVKHSTSFELRINLFAGGMMRMYEQWFNGNLNCSLNDISMEMSKIIIETSKEMLILN